MTKAEIISRIIDRIVDPWTDCPEDYADAELIGLDYASEIIEQCRKEDPDLEPEDRLPEETTPALMMEAFNCNVRMNQHKLQVNRLAEYITDNEMVCEYSNYYYPTLENGIDVVPVDFLYNDDCFPFRTKHSAHPDIATILLIGKNSALTFNSNDEYCWFDKETNTLHSTNNPFRDGILDAEAFAEFILSDDEALDYIVDCMEDDDVRYIFSDTKEHLLNTIAKKGE